MISISKEEYERLVADSRKLKRMREEQEVDEQLRFEGVVPNDIIVYMTRFLPFETLVTYCRSSLRFNEICKQNNISAMRLLVEKLLKKPNTMLLLNPSEKKYKFVDIKPDMDVINFGNVKSSLFDGYKYVYFSSLENPVFGGKLIKDDKVDGNHQYLYKVKVGGLDLNIILMDAIDEDSGELVIMTDMSRDQHMYRHMAAKYGATKGLDAGEIDHLISASQEAYKEFDDENQWNSTFADGDPFGQADMDNADELDAFRHYIMENFDDVYKYYNLNFTTM